MKKKTFSAYNFLTALILCLLTVLFIFPFYWIMTGAFKSQPDTIIIPPLLSSPHNGGPKHRP